MKKILQKIFSIKNEEDKLIIKFMGFRISIKKMDKFISSLKDDLNNVGNLNVNMNFMLGSFFDFISKENIQEDYVNLIKNLDEESIKVVSRIISRIRQLKQTGSRKFILSEQEVIQKKALMSEFFSLIIKLNDDAWAYQKYLLPINHFEASVFYYKHFLNEFNHLDSNKCVIDVGGFIGDSAIVLSEYFNDKIYSFEPLNENYELLLKTIELNKQMKNIVPVNMGLGESEGKLDIYSRDSASGLLKRFDAIDEKETINITTLDKYVDDNNLQVGLIKVDIEGAEQFFLKGARKTICEQKPALIISLYHQAEDFFYIKPMIESWGDLGYKFKIRQPILNDIHVETILIAEAE